MTKASYSAPCCYTDSESHGVDPAEGRQASRQHRVTSHMRAWFLVRVYAYPGRLLSPATCSLADAVPHAQATFPAIRVA
jgi:hypothetical protein